MKISQLKKRRYFGIIPSGYYLYVNVKGLKWHQEQRLIHY